MYCGTYFSFCAVISFIEVEVIMIKSINYPAFGGWIVETYMEGMVQQEDGSIGPLYISRHDGEFTGDYYYWGY